jgi:hypothetical protein
MTEPTSGVITHRGVLDLSRFTSADDLAAIQSIVHVGTVIVPDSLAAAFTRIPSAHIGSVVQVPDGANVRVHTGSLVVGGDGLGSGDDVLVIVGMLVITSPVTGTVPRRIHVVGTVLAPKGSEAALNSALGGVTGSIDYYTYREGQEIKVSAGQVKLSGAMLANPAGQPDDILVAGGQIVVTGAVTKVGFAKVIVGGQLAAPAAGQEVLEPWLEVHGQVAWYRGDKPWIVMDSMEIGPDFFRLLDEPVSLIVMDTLTVRSGVTEDQVREKVAGISLLGDIVAPAELVGVLQVLTTDALGTIRTPDGPSD